MPRNQPQGKHWVATLFEDEPLDAEELKTAGIVRAVWQHEIAPTTGMYILRTQRLM